MNEKTSPAGLTLESVSGGRGRRRSATFFPAILTCLFLVATLAPSAEAAQWNSLDGDCNTSYYYESTIDRHVTTPNDTIYLKLSSMPSQGVSWFVDRASDGTPFGGYVSIVTLNYQYTIATGVQSGTIFHNSFKGRYNGGHFVGSEYY